MSRMQAYPDPRRTRRRRMIGIMVIGPLVLLTAGVALLYWAYEQDRRPKPDSGRPGAWTAVSSEEVSRFVRVGIPAAAADVRWAYQNGFQDDLAVLAFRLPQAGLEDFKSGLPVSGWAETGQQPVIDMDGFQHAGAPDPSDAHPLTCGGFLSPAPAKRIATRVCLAPQPDGTSQVWVRAFQTS
ncbi:hypothetical protein ACFVUH_28880 [Kitasatospora sp. NPDC058032]|uniref:hypothetical protein n=1 Tax=Kitasatospora sp. NPDC058032 TaxID=3346307 RepID=UPI0036DD7C6B